MSKCEVCGLRYRGTKAGEKPTPEKVERHNAGTQHVKRSKSK